MALSRLLAALAVFCRHRAGRVVLVGLVLAVLGMAAAAWRLGVSTDTDALFDPALPWRQREVAFNAAFPQFKDLLVAVVQGATPEEADETAAALAEALARDPAHFRFARRPDAAPWFARNGLLFLGEKDLSELLDRTIDAQPFLGQLASDPSARGLFATLALVAMGVERGEAALDGFRPALATFERALAEAAAGKPEPLSWQRLLAGKLAELAGPRRLVLAQARLDLGALEPGGAAGAALRRAAAEIAAVKAGRATVRVTGPVALADEEFATVAQGAAGGMAVSAALVLLWLVLAVRSWRLIVAIVATLWLGLAVTTGFAALAVGTLNLVSVAFAVLFVGIAVDFAIQFCVRYREQRLIHGEAALGATMAAVGPQIVLAAVAIAAGFLAFVPTSFRGVAELGLIAGVGMLIALAATLTFLPAMLVLLRPRGEAAEVGFAWAGRLEGRLLRVRLPVAAGFAALCLLGAALLPRLAFDSDPLHTKNPGTEAMTTLRALMDDPLTSPYTADVLVADAASAEAMMARLRALPLAAEVVSLPSLVPAEQAAKLPLIADAASILGATLAPRSAAAPVTAADLRLAIQTARTEIERVLPKLPADDPLRGIAAALARLATAPDALLLATDAALTRFLPKQLDALRTALQAGPVTLAELPEDLARDWRAPDGRVRVQVSARPAAHDAAGLSAFVAEVRAVAPAAGGSAVTIVETAGTIVGAFVTAALGALAAIAVLLLLFLRRVADAGLVLGALLASALLVVPVAVLLPLPLNFANIVALPLLLGVGVSFNIYFVMNRRAGARAFLGTATARAVLFSALTTGTAFGSLAASGHPGTASMGALLLWSLGATMLVTLVLLPVVLTWRRAAVLLLVLMGAMPASADTLRPPGRAEQGGATVQAVWRFDAPRDGAGVLELEWTDARRVVERRRTALRLRGAREVAIPLDMRRAVAMENRLAATLTLEGVAVRREARFVASPPAGWSDWQTIMWQGRDAAAQIALRARGVTGAMVVGSREPEYDAAAVERRMAAPLAADARWYVENIATDFYANYHRWRPDRPAVTWLFDEAKRRWRADPADPALNLREPGLSDPAALRPILARLEATVRHQAAYRPFFYNLADEPGIADLAAAWDFDFSASALAGFRAWLRTQYRDLGALNRQWGSDFAGWEAVVPPTTDQALARADRNWSGWGDFKAWMDRAFAGALRAGAAAVHAADPAALAGIAGAQLPGWGGYDYGLLAGAVDVIEAYDGGNNLEIARSLNPGLVLLTTSFGGGPTEAGRLWRTALLGARGVIVWDEDGGFAGARGEGLAPTLRELAGGIGAQLIAAAPQHDGVAILYSQASFRVQWLQRRLGEVRPWQERTSGEEWEDMAPHRVARARAARLVSALGAQPRWLASEGVAGGALRAAGLRLLILPAVTALSDAEAAEIAGFAARGGTVLTMGEVGRHDGHGRALARPQLSRLAPAGAMVAVPEEDAAALRLLGRLMPRARPALMLSPAAPDVETRVLRSGRVLIAGLQRRAEAAGEATEVTLIPPAGHVAWDMRAGRRLGGGRLALRLVGQEPAVLALSPVALPGPTLAVPAAARPGEVVTLHLGHAGRSPAAAPLIRLSVAAPDGSVRFGATVPARARALPLAADAAAGGWEVRAVDVLSGAEARGRIEVR